MSKYRVTTDQGTYVVTTEDQQPMGGKPPLGLVVDQISKLAPWNRASQGMRDLGGWIAEKGGYLGAKTGFPKTGQALGVGVGGAVALAPDILAAMTALPEEGPPNQALESLAQKAKQSASSRWFKAAGGTLSNAKELGPEESLRLGRLAREGRYVTPLNSAEAQSRAIEKGLQTSGKRLEELRGLGDLYGQSPEAAKIVQAIHQDIAPRYGTGIRSGEVGDLKKAIEEVMNLEPIDKLTATEEMAPRLKAGTIEHGVPSEQADPFGMIKHENFPPKESYEQFRRFQEDPNFIPEYDFRRPTTFNEVSRVATDINKYAKGQSQLLQPSGAMTDVANLVSKMNNEALLKSLPQEKALEYTQNLQKYSDLSKLERMNELKSAAEVGESRNRIVNNIANRIFHRFGYQLSAETMDKISELIGAMNKGTKMNPASSVGIPKLLKRYRDENSSL